MTLVAERPATVGRRPPEAAPRAPKQTRRPLELDTVASRWQLALDADHRALDAAAETLPISELAARRAALAEERRQAARGLDRLAHATGVRPVPWLAPSWVTPRLLGLPETVEACLFDLDGVLTDSGVLHALAWAVVFDDFLQRIAERNGWEFIPFDRVKDYLAYIDGRPRLEGIHAFLSSRGIRVPEGRPEDPADADTAYGLARHKGEALARSLHHRGVTAVAGARRYLEATGHAGLKRAVVSASLTTSSMLELAGLATLVEEHIDAEVIRRERLRARPAPDQLLTACRRLDVEPAQAATFTSTPAGVAAGRAAGLLVVGVGDDASQELLGGFGADRVVASLGLLLDRRLRGD